MLQACRLASLPTSPYLVLSIDGEWVDPEAVNANFSELLAIEISAVRGSYD